MTVFNLGIFTPLAPGTRGARGGGLLIGIAYSYVGQAKADSSVIPAPPDDATSVTPARVVTGPVVRNAAPARYAAVAAGPRRPRQARRTAPPPPRQLPNGDFEYRRPRRERRRCPRSRR